MTEIWKEHWYYTKYEISNFGRVRNKRTKRIRKLTKNSYGYLTVKLHYNGYPIGVHRLVFETFYRRLLPNEQAHHLNEMKDCNISTNLVAWDRARHGEFHANENREEIGKRMSAAHKGKTPWNKGKKTPVEVLKKKSQSMKRFWAQKKTINI